MALINILIRLFNKFNGDRSRLEPYIMNLSRLNRVISLKKLRQEFSMLFFGHHENVQNLFSSTNKTCGLLNYFTTGYLFQIGREKSCVIND